MTDRDDIVDDALLLQELESSLRHGLRNHFSAIRNAAYFLDRRLKAIGAEVLAADPRLGKMLALLETEVRSAESLLGTEPRIDDVLARETGDCDPAEAVRSLVAELGPIAASRISFVAATSDRASTSSRLLRRALAPILANALDATGADGAIVVRVRTVGDGDVVVEVEDEGTELGAAYPPPVPFASSKDGHLGVGLVRARRAARLWHGSLTIGPRDPRGTVVSLTIPAALGATEGSAS